MQYLQVLNQRVRAWAADPKKDREAGSFQFVTGILHTEGEPEEVCDFILPKEHPEVKPGFYSCELKLFSSFEKRLMGKIVRLIPYVPVRAAGVGAKV